MDKNKYKLDKSKMTPDQLDRLERWQQAKDQLHILDDIANIAQEAVRLLDEDKAKGETSNKEMGACLLDMREALNVLKDKEVEPVDNQPVIDAVSKLEKKLTAALKGIEVKPQVNVSSPDVNVPVVDLSGIEKVIKTIPAEFKKAIKLIPQPEPEDNSAMLAVWEGISEQLVSLENATRIKPQPGKIAVSNLADIPVVDTSALATVAKQDDIIDKLDDTETTLEKINTNAEEYGINNIDPVSAVLTYTGKEDKDGNWLVVKIDTTTGTEITYATEANNALVTTYADAWTNHLTLTYGLFSAAF